jgi:hypothetical protein
MDLETATVDSMEVAMESKRVIDSIRNDKGRNPKGKL